MELHIEKAARQDLDAVAELYGAVCGYLADKPYNPGWRRDAFPARENAEQYLAANGLYVAREGGETAGSIAMTSSPSAEEAWPGRTAYSIFTLPPSTRSACGAVWRGPGGRLIFNDIISFEKEQEDTR